MGEGTEARSDPPRRTTKAEGRRRIVVIVGPTAGGKSALAVAVARALAGQIINADSMQVYRELNAGTAKPSAQQRAAVVHHLIDVVEPTEPFSVADWLTAAEALIEEMHDRGVLPIVAGGTNLYLNALLRGMFEGPAGDEAFRASLDAIDAATLHAQLTAIDPDAASRIFPNDRKRIVRALEVHHVTGQRISALQTQWEESKIQNPKSEIYHHDPIMVGLRWPVEVINRRINARVKAMFQPEDEGEDLISETRRLLEAGRLGPQAREAIGTKQVLEHLAGRCTAEAAMERVKIATRRFGKQQRTWLKRYRGVHWLAGAEKPPEAVAEAAIGLIRGALGRSGNT